MRRLLLVSFLSFLLGYTTLIIQLQDKVQQLERQLAETTRKLETASTATVAATETTPTASVSSPFSATNPSFENLLPALESLTIDQEESLLDALHGKEYLYRLSCPGHFDDGMFQLLKDTNSTVIIGWHVGMINNWRLIFRDQLQTLHTCGMEDIADTIYLSYSNNATPHEELGDLQTMMRRYPKLQQMTTLLYGNQQPIEGAAIRAVHAECQRRHPPQSFPPALNPPTLQGDTIAFYFHTKGSSRYTEDWRDHMDAKFQYPTALYWRKYMEYFTIERLHVCIRSILQHGKFGCGVWWAMSKFYGGNFWAASGKYLASLQPLPAFPITMTKKRWLGEGYITEELRDMNETEFRIKYMDRFTVASNPRGGLYRHLIRPLEFSDYNRRWSGWWKGEDPM